MHPIFPKAPQPAPFINGQLDYHSEYSDLFKIAHIARHAIELAFAHRGEFYDLRTLTQVLSRRMRAAAPSTTSLPYSNGAGTTSFHGRARRRAGIRARIQQHV